MNFLIIAIAIFLFMEIMNIGILYFRPGSKLGNGVGVFKAWEKSKKDKEVHELVKYLVYWVAGSKLIFIALLFVIIFTGTWLTQLAAVGVMAISIMTFFWKLFPIVRNLDKKNQLSPKGYSKTLMLMIISFVALFVLAFALALI
jgi:hypothetical protein